MKYYFLRHGITSINKNNLCLGSRSDPEILPEANQKLCELAEKIKDKEFIAIYSSPLIRCLQTAYILQERLRINCEIKSDRRLIEIDFGSKYTERSFEEMRLFGDDKFLYNTNYRIPPDGESLNDVGYRIKDFLKDTTSINHKWNILVISHGLVIHSIEALVKNQNSYELMELAIRNRKKHDRIITFNYDAEITDFEEL